MPADGLAAFRRAVFADPVLAERLRALAPERFEREAAAIAGELDFDVTAGDVAAAARANDLAWHMRWTT